MKSPNDSLGAEYTEEELLLLLEQYDESLDKIHEKIDNLKNQLEGFPKDVR